MKKIISTFLIIFILFFNINFSYAADCKYQSQIDSCIELNEDGNTLSEEEFLCVSERSKEKIVYNLILNEKFKIIDEEADLYLADLQKGKSRFFGPDQKEPYLVGVDEIEKLFSKNGFFYNKYQNELPAILSETIDCLGGKVSNLEAKDFFAQTAAVEGLILDKNATRTKVAYDVMKLNKGEVRNGEKKKYVQVKRTRYSIVSDLFMISVGYLLKIMKKWASKTRNPYHLG